MSRYGIRVELNGGSPSYDTYQRLHELMRISGWYRAIQADDGSWYEMPKATYQGIAWADVEAVRDAVNTIAKQVWSDVDVLVFEYSKAAWVLKPINTQGLLAA